uniref:Uncharacterized protein AlNc14C6G820 n=1 Tax=Albugo laibachii Nc14 TaxID=890382 RepID=F0W141_9STRA|nr:hypothetical protein PITG_05634 [Albugo laibachii Nc14]|eukprot:CCA14765.1 hypothetical protein PITG_05634 [Albugo laibachii Nc14]
MPSRSRSASQVRLQDEASAHGRNAKLHNFRRYLQSVESLYCHPKSHTQFHANFTRNFTQLRQIACDAFPSELRAVQFYEKWTYLEIGIFEECIDRFGKCFHKIAREIPGKSVRDVISFYYLWKRCNSDAVGRKRNKGRCTDKEQVDLQNMNSALRNNIDRYKGRRLLLGQFFRATRSLYGAKNSLQPLSKRFDLKKLKLEHVGAYRACIQGNAQLRPRNILDSWSPLDIHLFEQGIKQYGKCFHLVAQKVGTKTCGQVIAFYYVWKKEANSSS